MATKYLDLTGLQRYDGKIKNYIDDAVGVVQANLETEASARESEDTSLGSRVSTLENAGYITKDVNNLTNYYNKSTIDTKLTGAYIYKGSKTVAQINALTGMTNGDVYNVSDSGTITTGGVVVVAGDNVAWDGTSWDKLAGTIDLSGFVPTSRKVNGHALTDDVTVSKSDVGLGSVINTGDSATPVQGGSTKFTTGGAYTELAKKVDKVTGKGLSTNDYTTAEKNKLAAIADGAEVNVQANWSETTTTSDAYIQNKPTALSDFTNDLVASITNSEIDNLFV